MKKYVCDICHTEAISWGEMVKVGWFRLNHSGLVGGGWDICSIACLKKWVGILEETHNKPPILTEEETLQRLEP